MRITERFEWTPTPNRTRQRAPMPANTVVDSGTAVTLTLSKPMYWIKPPALTPLRRRVVLVPVAVKVSVSDVQLFNPLIVA